MEFSRPEYWSGSLSPSPGDLPNPGIKPRFPALRQDFLPAEPQGKPKNTGVGSLSLLWWIFLAQELNWGLLHCRCQGGVNLGCTGRDSARCGWGVGPCCAPGGRQYGWEPAGSPAGPGRNLAARGGVGVRSQRGLAPGRGGGGLSRCAVGGRHCGWECPFHELLDPQGSASIGHSGGVRNTGKGTGTAWSREPCIPPCVGTVSELPNLTVAERPRLWGQGLYRSTPLLKNLRVCAVFCEN